VPALPPYIIEPIWEQFEALLPERETDHPLGCHRPRISERLVFEKLVQILVFGCAYWRIADESCSESTLRREGARSGSSLGSWRSSERDLPRSLRSTHRAGVGRSGGGRVHNQSPLWRRESGKKPGG
jgi:transposase